MKRITALIITFLFIATALLPLISANASATTGSGRFYPAADAYVSLANPSTNYGSATTMINTWGAEESKMCFLRWDLSSIPTGATLTDVHLNLYCTATSSTGYMIIYGAAYTDWSESTITWSNKPGSDSGNYIGDNTLYATGWQNWSAQDNYGGGGSVLETVKNAFDTNKKAYIILSGANLGAPDKTRTFETKEGTNDPYLYIAYTYTPATWAPTFTSTPITNVKNNSAYSYTVTANETCTGWAMSSNATWLSFGAANHTVYGRPSLAHRSYYVHVNATSSVGHLNAWQNYTLYVNYWSPHFTSSPAITTIMVDYYRYDFTTNESCSMSLTTNASWLVLRSGYVNGTPTYVPAKYWINLTATNAVGGHAYQNYTLNVTNVYRAWTNKIYPTADAMVSSYSTNIYKNYGNDAHSYFSGDAGHQSYLIFRFDLSGAGIPDTATIVDAGLWFLNIGDNAVPGNYVGGYDLWTYETGLNDSSDMMWTEWNGVTQDPNIGSKTDDWGNYMCWVTKPTLTEKIVNVQDVMALGAGVGNSKASFIAGTYSGVDTLESGTNTDWYKIFGQGTTWYSNHLVQEVSEQFHAYHYFFVVMKPNWTTDTSKDIEMREISSGCPPALTIRYTQGIYAPAFTSTPATGAIQTFYYEYHATVNESATFAIAHTNATFLNCTSGGIVYGTPMHSGYYYVNISAYGTYSHGTAYQNYTLHVYTYIAPTWTGHIQPTADSYVASNSPTSNYGTQDYLDLFSTGFPTNYNRYPYLRWDLSSVIPSGASITDVEFFIYKWSGDNSGTTKIMKQSTRTVWGETTITWNNKPAIGSQISSFTNGATGWYEVHNSAFTASVASQFSTDGKVFIILTWGTVGQDQLYRSKEKASYEPYLRIYYSSPKPWAPVITSTPSAFGGYHNMEYYYNATANTTCYWDMETNASFLSIDGSNGKITGTLPATDGSYYVNVSAVSVTGSLYTHQNYTFSVETYTWHPMFLSTPITTGGVKSGIYGYKYDVVMNESCSFTLATDAPFLSGSVNGTNQWIVHGDTNDPAAMGTFYVHIKATNTAWSYFTWQNYSLTITNLPPVFTSTPPTTWRYDIAFTYDADAPDPEGYSIYYDVATDFTGATINHATGVVSKSLPHSLGTYYIHISADDGIDTAWQNFTLVISAMPPANNLIIRPAVDTYTTWTGFPDDSNHFKMLNETFTGGDVNSYVEYGGSYAPEWYEGTTFIDPAIPAERFSVSVWMIASFDTSVLMQFGLHVPTGNYGDVVYGLGPTYQNYTHDFGFFCPWTGLWWTVADINDINFLIYHFNIAGNIRVTQMAALITITIADITPPVADAGIDQTKNQHQTVTFDGSGSWDNIGIVNYSWSWTDVVLKHAYGVNPTSSAFDTAGAFIVTLRCEDSSGNFDTDTMQVTALDNENPVAITYNQTATLKVEGYVVVAFDGSHSTDNIGVTNWTWQLWYNGTMYVSYGSHSGFTFHLDGIFNLTLTVRDALGNSNSTVKYITILPHVPGGWDWLINGGILAIMALAGFFGMFIGPLVAVRIGRDSDEAGYLEAFIVLVIIECVSFAFFWGGLQGLT